MKVSKRASEIYQTAKASASGEWTWKLEWSRAMKQAWREMMNKEKEGWKFEAKSNGMIFFWSPLTQGRGMLDISTIKDGIIYNKKGLGVTLKKDGKSSNIGVRIDNKPGLAKAIRQAKDNEEVRKPVRQSRALYNWIQAEGYNGDGEQVARPC